MSQSERNYARFFALLKDMPGANKAEMVQSYTDNRTEHLNEMTEEEYTRMVEDMAKATTDVHQTNLMFLRRQRSRCLKHMQQLGVDTTNWDRVNAFCEDKRIAGKAFGWLTFEELRTLATKLRAIQRNGGLKTRTEDKPTDPMLMIFNNNNTAQS